MSNNLRFKQPFTCIISGPSGSGKSSFCLRFLQNIDSCTEQDFDGGVIWCYSVGTPVPEQQLALPRKNIRINEGVPENFDNTQGKPCLIIHDDLLNDVHSKEVWSLFPKMKMKLKGRRFQTEEIKQSRRPS